MKILFFLLIIVTIVYSHSHDGHSHKCNHDDIQKNIKVGIVNDGLTNNNVTSNEFLKLER